MHVLGPEQTGQHQCNLLHNGSEVRDPVESRQDLRQGLATPSEDVPECLTQSCRGCIPHMPIGMYLYTEHAQDAFSAQLKEV